MKRMIAVLISLALLLCMLPVTVLAADISPADGYNDHDYAAIRAFLETEVDSIKNGARIGSYYDADNPSTWPGITWNSDAEKRVTIVDFGMYNVAGPLDVSECSALTTIFCQHTQVTSLNASGCTSLQTIQCYNGILTSLNASGCTSLQSVFCGNNSLSSFDISGCTALETLSCGVNLLSSLDVSGFTALSDLYCESNSLASLNVGTNTALQTLSCNSNLLTALNVSGCTALTSLVCNSNELTSLDVSGCSALTSLICNSNELTSLDVSGLTALQILTCNINHLTSLDVSHFTALQRLQCDDNSLTELDVSGCTALEQLICNKNSLTELDVSGSTGLKLLQCDHNQIASLDVSNHTALTNLICAYNSLISLDVGGCTHLTSFYCNNNVLTSLDVSSGFTALRFLVCDNNSLESLDTSELTALQILRCGNNLLSSLDVSNCNVLTELDCSHNQLEALDLSTCTALTELTCCYNQLEALDISYNTALEYLDYEVNSVESLNLSGNTDLYTLYCNDNKLTELDATACTLLADLYCEDNPLSSVDTILEGARIKLTANGSGSVGLIYDEGYCYRVIATPTTGAAFYDWTDAADAQVSTTAQTDISPITEYDLTANFLYLAGDPADGKIDTGGHITLTPGIPGGTWDFDTALLSRDGNEFTGLKAGTATVTYTLNAVTVAFDITISAQDTILTPTPTYTADVMEGGVKTDTLPVTVNNTETGTVSLNMARAEELFGSKDTSIVVPIIAGVSAYNLELPASALAQGQKSGELTVDAGFASVKIPDSMLSNLTGTNGKTAGITVARADRSGLTEAEKAAVGNRPLVRLTLTLGGEKTEWNNSAAPVKVTIPYTPTAEELKTPGSIVIWYLDGSGVPVCVPNGHYDAATGAVTFSTTHFSQYAIGFNPVSFNDVTSGSWYHNAVTFCASRGITAGLGNNVFSAEGTVTRGQFLVMLMRAYGIEPDEKPADNFSDAGNSYYTGYLAAAKRLSISNGVGDNMYAPELELSRQDMFTLLYRTLNILGELPATNTGKTLADFSDSDLIADYAVTATEKLVAGGIVSGNQGRLSPGSNSTRAQVVQVLYKLLSV